MTLALIGILFVKYRLITIKHLHEVKIFNMKPTAKLRMMVTAMVAFMLMTQLGYSNNSKPSYFYEGNFETAKKKAGVEGKLFMVDFYADWCVPCKWMDKFTFEDNKIKEILNEDFVSIKVDIDRQEGYNLKEKFGVTTIPTLLIFNSQGKMVERLERTMTAEDLAAVLQFHNYSANKVKQKHYINRSPSNTEIKENSNHELNKLYKEYKNKQERKTSYRVQVGYYNSYEEAFNKVSTLRETFLESIIVLTDFRDGVTMYRLCMGEFPSMEEADSFRKILQNDYQIKGIIY